MTSTPRMFDLDLCVLTITLEPGGFLQWSEQDYLSQKVISANSDITLEPFNSLKEELETQSRTTIERFK